MSESVENNHKVSIVSRILAWILLGCGVLAILLLVLNTYHGKAWPWTVGETILSVFAMAMTLAMASYVAFKGRSPQWLTSMEDVYDQEASRRNIRVTTVSSFQRLVLWVASVVFGLFLVLLGNWLGIFSDDSRWFAIAVFALAWLIVVVLMWRFSRKTPRAVDSSKMKTNDE